MIEKSVPIEFTDEISETYGPPIIGVFGKEHTGKTRFALTLPDPIGFLPLEMKSFDTIKKDSETLGKRVILPKDPYQFIPRARLVNSMKDDSEKQNYYKQLVKNIENSMYDLLEREDIRGAAIDKFSMYCQFKEWAINGMLDKPKPIDGKLVRMRGEFSQAVTDFITSLHQFGKPVVLLCAEKPDFKVKDSEGNSLRQTFDCNSYYFLGSHTNVTCQIESNDKWKESSTQKDKKWKYRLSVRTCQINTSLEGPEGNPLFESDGSKEQSEVISYPSLMQAINPDVDVDTLI